MKKNILKRSPLSIFQILPYKKQYSILCPPQERQSPLPVHQPHRAAAQNPAAPDTPKTDAGRARAAASIAQNGYDAGRRSASLCFSGLYKSCGAAEKDGEQACPLYRIHTASREQIIWPGNSQPGPWKFPRLERRA